jgi:hypothetical protein
MAAVLAFHRAVRAAPCAPQSALADAALRGWARRLIIRDDIARGRYADARAELGRLATDAMRSPDRLAALLWADHERLAAQLEAAIAEDAP